MLKIFNWCCCICVSSSFWCSLYFSLLFLSLYIYISLSLLSISLSMLYWWWMIIMDHDPHFVNKWWWIKYYTKLICFYFHYALISQINFKALNITFKRFIFIWNITNQTFLNFFLNFFFIIWLMKNLYSIVDIT